MRTGSCGRRLVRCAQLCSATSALLACSSIATAQALAPNQDQGKADEHSSDIIIIGNRLSVMKDVAPIAELNADALAAIGASSMAELKQALQGQTQSADGSAPIFLLDAQRVSGYQEIDSLPPEAIEKVEVLPEQAAVRFGFPPTRRVVNFITKRRFRQVDIEGSVSTTVPWGSATEKTRVGFTRLREGARITANVEYRRTDPLFYSDRSIAADPDIPFDAIGNITGLGGGEIDSALSGLAGRPVTIAPVPDAPVDRSTLARYVAGGNRPRLFGLGPYATLVPGNDTVHGEGVVAGRIGGTLAGSLNLSAEQSRDRGLGGPAPASLIVPSSNPFSPFAGPVVLNRYLTEVDALRQRETITTFHAGAVLRGAVAGWLWDVTAALDQKQIDGRNERGIDLTAANAAIAAGTNPFSPLDPGLLAARQIDRTRQRTRTAQIKAVATKRPIQLPAGKVTLTATIEADRSTAVSSSRTAGLSDFQLGRTRMEGAIALDVPLTSRRDNALPFVGDLSVNASANLRRVGGFGALHDTTFGLVWGPIEGVQLLAGVRRSATAPDLAQQSTPSREVANAPVFDFGSGRTELVTLIQGGNPDLLAERRLVRSLAFNIKPFAQRQLRFSATYEETTIRNQTATIRAITPETERIVPELVTRDAAGRLTSVTYRPTNFYLEHKRGLQLTLNSSGKLGKAPPPAPSGSKKQPPPRPGYYGGIGATIKFRDALQLRPGTRVLDLLRGDSVGTWTPRIIGSAYGGINYRGYGATMNAWYGGPRRVRSANPSADLRFLSIFRLNIGAYLPFESLVPRQKWARNLQIRVNVDNLTDARQRVRDRLGAVPYRYQTDYIDPIGRTLTITLRERI